MDALDIRNVTSAWWGADTGAKVPAFVFDAMGIVLWATHLVVDILRERWVQDTLKMMLLGTIMETVRSFWSTISVKAMERLYVEARIENGDFAWDWLDDYLNAHNVWGRAPTYRVTTTPLDGHPKPRNQDSEKGTVGDSHPRPIYQSIPDQPEFWKWKGHWIKVCKAHGRWDYSTGGEVGGYISLSVYSWKRWVIDNLIDEAREQYIKGSRPRFITSKETKGSSVITAEFVQPDLAHEWIHAFLGSLGAFDDVNSIRVSAKHSTGPAVGIKINDTVAKDISFVPTEGAPHIVKWNGIWIEVGRSAGTPDWRTGAENGAKITIMMHHAHHDALGELVAAAREYWAWSSSTNITIHLADSTSWTKVVKKSRRSLDSVILPAGVKEMLLEDTREFVRSAQWYKDAGVPYRRGYLLYGVPGAGKSSTIHALASELTLPIYSVSLAARGLTDFGLQSLISDTPTDSILVLEDIDCAFPLPRRGGGNDDEDEEEDENTAPPWQPSRREGRTSEVTMSGLLNAIDGVWSEEGRILFATTNHIESLDPALIRPGRLDVKVHYTASKREQSARMFTRFFPAGDYPCAAKQSPEDEVPAQREIVFMDVQRLSELAEEFAAGLLEDAFSTAALQGYLLLWKKDPLGAVAGVAGLVQQYEEEARTREEERLKAKAARAKFREEQAERMKTNVNFVVQPPPFPGGYAPYPDQFYPPASISPEDTIVPAELLAGI